jgi:hypothetical protein
MSAIDDMRRYVDAKMSERQPEREPLPVWLFLFVFLVLLAVGCGSVTSSQLTTDAGEESRGMGAAGAGAAGTGGNSGAGGAAGSSSGGRGGAAQVDAGDAVTPSCSQALVDLVDCQIRIDGGHGGYQCARSCRTEYFGQGVDLAAAGACLANGVTYCVPPRDGGDACAACP